MSKRKRGPERAATPASDDGNTSSKAVKENGYVDTEAQNPVIQVVAGTYERVLHGISASISQLASSDPSTHFTDTFLFNAHASAIRCLAISPLANGAGADSGVYLATGGSDERVNVYSLSASPLLENDKLPSLPTLGSNKLSEHPRNRELGSLMQHSSNITSLHFPSRSKLLSASEDNTISITRTRDLEVVSMIKAPRPKVQGQPSGDTAPPGATPAGINDFAVHPSMKLMISVGRGEKTMRLWNLVTGKKASVLNFDRDMLQDVRESKHSSGEGRRIRWNSSGSEFAISFERGVVVFGDDAKPKCTILPQPLTKIHQIAYQVINEKSVLAMSTEDGRIIFYDTDDTSETADSPARRPNSLFQIGGKSVNLGNRVKDFKILAVPDGDPEKIQMHVIVVAGSSDGTIRVWYLPTSDIDKSTTAENTKPVQVGKLLGTYETGNRITCLDAFVMLPATVLDDRLSEFEGLTEAEEGESSSSSDTDST